MPWNYAPKSQLDGTLPELLDQVWLWNLFHNCSHNIHCLSISSMTTVTSNFYIIPVTSESLASFDLWTDYPENSTPLLNSTFQPNVLSPNIHRHFWHYSQLYDDHIDLVKNRPPTWNHAKETQKTLFPVNRGQLHESFIPVWDGKGNPPNISLLVISLIVISCILVNLVRQQWNAHS